MGSMAHLQKPHAVCIPHPAQGHINPMLKLAKLLHSKGFHITFVNSEYNHKRLLNSRGHDSLDGLPTFKFERIPDGLPPPDVDATQDIPSLCDSTKRTCLAPFRELLLKLNDTESSNVPPVSCIVSDGVMSFTIDAAEELDIPQVIFWTTSACGFLGYVHYRTLIEQGHIPFKDDSYLSNGQLDVEIDLSPGMKNIRLRDIPSFIRTTNPDDFMLHFMKEETERAQRAFLIIVNTYDMLEHDILDSLSSIYYPPIYSIGPLHLLLNQVQDEELKTIESNLWKEDDVCLEWLDTKEPNSVIYVNFGSITTITSDQLIEFAWGLANCMKNFLWVIRPDIVAGDTAVLPPEFSKVTKERGLLVSWCPQVEVLNHTAVGGFLTHSGWNSTLESISAGVPMICWPFFAEQQTNCRYSCVEWGIGMEVGNDVKRDEVEGLVKELMDGDKGKDMKKRAVEWKRLAEEAVDDNSNGTSYTNLDKMINHVLSFKTDKQSEQK